MDRVCFSIFGRPVYWYGVMVALGFLAAMVHWTRTARRLNYPPETASDLTFWIMVGGILGARAAYVLANLGEYLKHPLEILRIDHGGLVFYGGAIGGTLAVILYALRRKTPLWAFGDYAVAAVPLGHALGRVGCFLNDCCFGRLTASWYGVTWHGEQRIPVALIEAALNLGLWGILTHLLLGRHLRPGRVVAGYALAYGLIRFTMEFLRGDERIACGPCNAAQCTSLLLFAAGLLIWFRRDRTPASA